MKKVLKHNLVYEDEEELQEFQEAPPSSYLSWRHTFTLADQRRGGAAGKGKAKIVDPDVARERAQKAAAAKWAKYRERRHGGQ